MTRDDYVLVNRLTGQPLTIYSNDDVYELSKDMSLPVLSFESLDSAVFAIGFKHNGYSKLEPSLAGIKPSDIVICRRTTSYESVSYDEPCIVSGGIVERRLIPRVLARKLCDVPGTIDTFYLFLVNTKKCSVNDFSGKVGKVIHIESKYDAYLVHGVCQAREENRDLGDVEIVCVRSPQ